MQSLALHRLTFVDDGDQVMVGRAEVESYAAFPVEGAELLRRLYEGMPPEQAATWFTQSYGQPVDMDDFLATLDDLGFVDDSPPGRSAAGPASETDPGAVPPQAVRWQWLGRAVFSPPAWIVFAVLVAWCVWTMWHQPDLRPSPRQVFFTPSLATVDVVMIASAAPSVLFHEMFHALAGRRLGLASRLSVGRRLYYLVGETVIPGLLGVPRRKRYLPLLAGILGDIALISVLTLAAAALREPGGGISWPGRLALAFAYTKLLGIIWQFFFFLQTDLYHVFTTATRCHNLHQVTRTWIRNRLWRAASQRHRMTDESWFSPRDRKTARWFAPLTIAGITTMIAVAALSTIPILVHFLALAGGQLRHGDLGSSRFWDSLVTVTIIVAQFTLIGVMAARKRTRQRRARTDQATPANTQGVLGGVA